MKCPRALLFKGCSFSSRRHAPHNTVEPSYLSSGCRGNRTCSYCLEQPHPLHLLSISVHIQCNLQADLVVICDPGRWPCSCHCRPAAPLELDQTVLRLPDRRQQVTCHTQVPDNRRQGLWCDVPQVSQPCTRVSRHTSQNGEPYQNTFTFNLCSEQAEHSGQEHGLPHQQCHRE